MKKSKVSISSIAKELGISASTVSRALNNHPAISDEVKERVKKLAEELNYVPNQMAVNLKSGRRNTIGVILPSISRSFFSSVIDGIEDYAYQRGYDVLICQSKDDMDREKRLVSTISGRVDGVVASLAAHSHKHDYYNDLNVPLVLFDRTDSSLRASSVTIDDFGGAKRATEYLLNQGFRRVFHFSGPRHVNIWDNRYKGYLSAMQDAGIDVESNWVYEGVTTQEQGVKFAKKLLATHNIPDALFCSGDYAAIGLMMEFKKAGLRIPTIGFANEPVCELLDPSLSSVNQHSYKMGQTACRVLLDIIMGEPAENIVIQPELIIRESSGR